MIALDDNIEDHPKFVGLSNDAFALWVRGIGYCRRNKTDGFIPTQAAEQRARCKRPNQSIAELLNVAPGAPDKSPLWREVPGGYQVHDYLAWNPSRDDVNARIEQKRAAARAGGVASGQARANRSGTKPEPESKHDASPPVRVRLNENELRSDPDPIRSDPRDPPVVPLAGDTPTKPVREPKPRTRQATYVPAFGSDDEEAWLAAWDIPSASCATWGTHVSNFLDHYRAAGKPEKEWAARWRKWARNQLSDFGRRAADPNAKLMRSEMPSAEEAAEAGQRDAAYYAEALGPPQRDPAFVARARANAQAGLFPEMPPTPAEQEAVLFALIGGKAGPMASGRVSGHPESENAATGLPGASNGHPFGRAS